MSGYHSETSIDIEGMSCHCYEGEQYDDEYRPSSSSNYNLDHNDSRDSYTHQTTWSGGHDSSHLCDVDTDIVST